MDEHKQNSINQNMYNEWIKSAKNLFKKGTTIPFDSFAAKMLLRHGDIIRPALKQLYADMKSYIYSKDINAVRWMTSSDKVEAFDVNTINEDKLYICTLEEEIQRLEDIILSNAEWCAAFDDEIIGKICKRAIKEMNKKLSDIHFPDYYPDNFNFFDIISIEYNKYGYDDIYGMATPLMQNAIEGKLYEQTENLSPMEHYILYNSEVNDIYESDGNAVQDKILKAFLKMLDEHTYTKKIQNFLSTY